MKKTILLASTLFILLGADAYAASYMKIEGIKGEAGSTRNTATGTNWINIEDVTHAIGNAVNSQVGAGRQRARATAEDIIVTKPVDSLSPALSRAVATGKVFPKISLKHEVGGKSYTITLFNARLTSFGQSNTDDGWPDETLSLNYERVTWSYSDGNTQGSESWDFKSGK